MKRWRVKKKRSLETKELDSFKMQTDALFCRDWYNDWGSEIWIYEIKAWEFGWKDFSV